MTENQMMHLPLKTSFGLWNQAVRKGFKPRLDIWVVEMCLVFRSFALVTLRELAGFSEDPCSRTKLLCPILGLAKLVCHCDAGGN
jgi:hypothetical protein